MLDILIRIYWNRIVWVNISFPQEKAARTPSTRNVAAFVTVEFGIMYYKVAPSSWKTSMLYLYKAWLTQNRLKLQSIEYLKHTKPKVFYLRPEKRSNFSERFNRKRRDPRRTTVFTHKWSILSRAAITYMVSWKGRDVIPWCDQDDLAWLLILPFGQQITLTCFTHYISQMGRLESTFMSTSIWYYMV